MPGMAAACLVLLAQFDMAAQNIQAVVSNQVSRSKRSNRKSEVVTIVYLVLHACWEMQVAYTNTCYCHPPYKPYPLYVKDFKTLTDKIL